MFVETVFESSIAENLAWTMLNSVWQITFIALMLFILLRLLPKSNANARYVASLSAIVLIMGLPIATFFYLNQSISESKPLVYYENSMVSLKETAAVKRFPKKNISSRISGFDRSVKNQLARIRQFFSRLLVTGSFVFFF